MQTMDPKVVAAISLAVHAAVAKVGIDGIRNMSMFPSTTRCAKVLKLAA